LDWCFNRVEPGKFGDQKYLEEWPSRGRWVKVLDHPGVGLGPWNIQQVSKESNDPVFFHFHALNWYQGDLLYLGRYKIQSWARKFFYEPYLSEWVEVSMELNRRFHTPIPKSKIPQKRLKFFLQQVLYPARFMKANLPRVGTTV
jgi:hypothetical protein